MSIFFVYSSLPPLDFDSKPDISTEGLLELFHLNLSQSQLKKVHTFQLWIDLHNLYGSFDKRGVYSKSTLTDLLKWEEKLPDYVFEFLSLYETSEAQERNFGWLISAYFQKERKRNTGFVREFLQFEHEWRVIMAGYRGKKIGKSLGRELSFEDMDDPIVAMTLSQKDTHTAFVFPYEYKDLEQIIASAGPDPSKQLSALANYRFNFYQQIIFENPFTLKALIAYMMALWILEDYYALKQDKGEMLLETIVEKPHAK